MKWLFCVLEFPAAILQGGFFNKDNPKYMNYAGIGSLMGHELTHGLDDQGSRFDQDGNLVDWWDPKTKKEYLKRAQCIIDQYNGYLVKEVNLTVSARKFNSVVKWLFLTIKLLQFSVKICYFI